MACATAAPLIIKDGEEPLKALARSITPPIIWGMAHRLRSAIVTKPTPPSADDLSPPSADDLSHNYDNDIICELVAKKTAALSSKAFDETHPGKARLELLLPAIAAIAASRSGAHVLDFGGGAGFHHIVCERSFPARCARWAVVELPEMIEAARRFGLEKDPVRFFPSIDTAMGWLGHIDLMHSCGALQYCNVPERTLQELLATRPSTILWNVMPLADQRSVDVQVAPLRNHGPGPAPSDCPDMDMLHRRILLPRAHFFSAHAGYRLVWSSDDAFFFVKDNGAAL